VGTSPNQYVELGTQGWDLVSCATLPELNASIVAKKSSPPNFEVTEDGATVKGSFGGWQVGPNGSGYLVHLILPMTDIAISYQGKNWTVTKANATVELNLHYVPNVSDTGADGAQLFDLCVDPLGDSGITVSPVKVVDPKHEQDQSAVVIKVCLNAWLNKHLSSFSHVFASINVWSGTEQTKHPWLKPTSKGYAFCSLDVKNRSFLAVLAQTQNHSDKNLVYEVSPDALIQPYSRSVMISHNRLARDMLLPAVIRSFPGITPADFQFQENDRLIKLTRPRAVKGVEAKDKSYPVVLQEFNIQLLEDGFELDATTKSKVSPGIYSLCRSTGQYTLALIERSDGKQTLGIKMLSHTKPVKWHENEPWVEDLNLYLAVLSLVALAMAAVLTDGAALVAADMAAGLLLGSAVETAKIAIIDQVADGNGPPIDLMIANASAAVVWPDVEGFNAKAVDIIGGVRISGSGKSEALAHG
jgi:hypothetical protein